MIQEDDENLDGSFDVREERPSCRSEEVPDDIGCYLLLDGDGSVVGSEKLFELSFLLLEILEVVVVVLLDGFRGGEEVWKVEIEPDVSFEAREIVVGRRKLTILSLSSLTSRDESLHGVGKEGNELLGEERRDRGEVHERRLSKLGIVQLEGLEGDLERRLHQRSEEVLSNSLCDGPKGVGSDSSKLSLLSLGLELKEGLNPSDGGLEVGNEVLVGGVSG